MRLRRLPDWLTPHPTLVILIALNITVFILQNTVTLPFIKQYATIPYDIVTTWEQLTQTHDITLIKKFLPLLTATLLHGDIMHLAGNMLFLWMFGSLISKQIGKSWIIPIFMLTGVCGNIAQVLMNPDSRMPIFGASGAVTGFEGVYFGLLTQWSLPWPNVWPLSRPIPPVHLGIYALIGIFIDALSSKSNDHTAYGAHVGGFITGLIIAAIITSIYEETDQ